MTKKEFIERYGEEAYQRQLEYKKQWNKQHKEERNEYNKQYNQQHKEEAKQYYQQHKEERKEYMKQYQRKYNQMFAYCIPEQIEEIENYELAKESNFKGWHIHHRLETNNSDGQRRLVDLSKTELIALDMYYNRPANELVFLTSSEHSKLHRTKQHCSKE